MRSSVHATAKALAGTALAPGMLSHGAATVAWKHHSRALTAQFRSLERERLRGIRRWSARELKDVDRVGGTIFYPFAGPDALSAVTYFPRAKRYVLIGLEPVGPLPDLRRIPADSVSGYLTGIRTAMTSLLSLSFFRTNDMALDFAHTGVLPTLLVILTRTGYDVQSARLVALAPDGSVGSRGSAMAQRNTRVVHGVEITTLKGGSPVVVEYYAMDLSDGGLHTRMGARAFINSMKGTTTFVKAASYLMHKPYFSAIRAAVLQHSDYVLQDDSGIPYRFFTDSSRWSVKLYGHYVGPITMFKDWAQPSLDTAYQARGARPLPFGTGYRFEIGRSNLQLARRTRVIGPH